MTIRLLWRAFGPMLLRWMGKKAMEKVNRSFEKRTGNSQASQNTGTTVERNQSTGSIPREKKKVGEYVDFEEID